MQIRLRNSGILELELVYILNIYLLINQSKMIHKRSYLTNSFTRNFGPYVFSIYPWSSKSNKPLKLNSNLINRKLNTTVQDDT